MDVTAVPVVVPVPAHRGEPAGPAGVEGDLAVPGRVSGLVLFAHGSGSSRHSPRNRAVAEVLHRRGLGTLLLDLLTAQEDRLDARSGQFRFDIALLAGRLTAAVDWLGRLEQTRGLPMGLFGASTGAAAALVAAAERPGAALAVVSRGGRPDLAGEALSRVRAPTLLLIGERDTTVLELNQQAAGRIAGPCRIQVIPGATHLFEEPGALEQVADLAADWLTGHLVRREPPTGAQVSG